MKENPNQFRNTEVISVEKALLQKLEAIEKQHPKTFKGKEGTLKNAVILTYRITTTSIAFPCVPTPGCRRWCRKK
jgi:hypothetical protein